MILNRGSHVSFLRLSLTFSKTIIFYSKWFWTTGYQKFESFFIKFSSFYQKFEIRIIFSCKLMLRYQCNKSLPIYQPFFEWDVKPFTVYWLPFGISVTIIWKEEWLKFSSSITCNPTQLTIKSPNQLAMTCLYRHCPGGYALKMCFVNLSGWDLPLFPFLLSICEMQTNFTFGFKQTHLLKHSGCALSW